MPEMRITTHSKMKRFTDMDSSKWYEKKKCVRVFSISLQEQKSDGYALYPFFCRNQIWEIQLFGKVSE